MKNIQQTTFGAKVSIFDLNLKYRAYLDTTDEDLSYEFSCNDINVVVITGKNQEEKELPVLNFPLKIESLTGNNSTLVFDVRKYVQKNPKAFLNVEDIVTNKMEYEYSLIKFLLTLDYNVDETNVEKIKNESILVFRKWLVSIFAMNFNLNTAELIKLEIILVYYYTVICDTTEKENELSKNKFIARTTKKIKYGLSEEDISSVINKTETHFPKTVHDLIKMITLGVDSPKLKGLDLGGLSAVIKNSWFSTNPFEVLYIFENPQTLGAMIYASINNKGYSKTSFTNLTNKWSKDIEEDGFTKNIKRLSKEYITTNVEYR